VSKVAQQKRVAQHSNVNEEVDGRKPYKVVRNVTGRIVDGVVVVVFVVVVVVLVLLIMYILSL